MVVVLLASSLAASLTSSAGASSLPVRSLSGQPFAQLTSVERTTSDTTHWGGSVETVVAFDGGQPPFRVWVNYLLDRRHLVTTVSLPDPSRRVAATGQVPSGVGHGPYAIFNVVVEDGAGCLTASYGPANPVTELQPKPAGFTPVAHGLALETEAVVVGETPVNAFTVARAETLFDVRSAIDYSQSDADTLRLYRAFLNRNPDPLGSVYWITQTRTGATLDDLAWGFAQSDEFVAAYGPLSNEAFLTVLYDNMLGRIPDLPGFQYWLGQMNQGLAQHGVVRWIVANQEFIDNFPFDAVPPPDPGDVRNCADFVTSFQAQEWFDHFYPYHGDVAGLDGDNDLRVCESL